MKEFSLLRNKNIEPKPNFIAVGEKFTFENIIYICEYSGHISCGKCDFLMNEYCDYFQCSAITRSDKKEVIFREVGNE